MKTEWQWGALTYTYWPFEPVRRHTCPALLRSIYSITCHEYADGYGTNIYTVGETVTNTHYGLCDFWNLADALRFANAMIRAGYTTTEQIKRDRRAVKRLMLRCGAANSVMGKA